MKGKIKVAWDGESFSAHLMFPTGAVQGCYFAYVYLHGLTVAAASVGLYAAFMRVTGTDIWGIAGSRAKLADLRQVFTEPSPFELEPET